MKNWFNYFYRVIVIVFLLSFMYVFYFYVKRSNDNAEIGRYIPVSMLRISGEGGYDQNGEFSIRGVPFYVIIDTKTGNSYAPEGELYQKFEIKK